MALIKCSECGREIDNEASACIYCGNPIGTNKVYKTFNNKKTEETIYSLHNLSNIVLGIFMVLGIIIILLGGMTSTDSPLVIIFIGFTVIIFGVLLKLIFKWMAHILQNIYEINMNTKR